MTAMNPPTPDEPRPDASPPAAAAPAATSTGVDPKLAGLLAYVLGLVSGLVLFLVEKEHREVRYHAAQSVLVSGVLIALYVVLSVLQFIPVLGLLFFAISLLVGLASFALWIYLLIQGFHLNHVRLPVVGAMAERWVAA